MGGRFTWLRQLCGLDSYLALVLICFNQNQIRYRCYQEKICGCTSSACADLRASLATGVYMVRGVCVCGGGGVCGVGACAGAEYARTYLSFSLPVFTWFVNRLFNPIFSAHCFLSSPHYRSLHTVHQWTMMIHCNSEFHAQCKLSGSITTDQLCFAAVVSTTLRIRRIRQFSAHCVHSASTWLCVLPLAASHVWHLSGLPYYL